MENNNLISIQDLKVYYKVGGSLLSAKKAVRQYSPFVQINENHGSLCHFAEEVFAESLKESEKL